MEEMEEIQDQVSNMFVWFVALFTITFTKNYLYNI
jgi:hypothetical protein